MSGTISSETTSHNLSNQRDACKCGDILEGWVTTYICLAFCISKVHNKHAKNEELHCFRFWRTSSASTGALFLDTTGEHLFPKPLKKGVTA